ncbi:MAG TPA: hypothetical protein VLE97_08060 [Gaiellaceae bacterium]|nr:hypothetical protein [Gaiellaceae bacterium]
MSVAVIVPFAGDDPHRVDALLWVRPHYEWPVVLGASGGDQWCKAKAIENALQLADADVLVVADADVWAPDVLEAVSAVERGAAWAVPHRKVRRLSELSTWAVLTGAEPSEEMSLARNSYTGVIGGGVVVLPRALYDEVPIDPRFLGWGGEDYAWGFALTTIAGPPARSSGPLWHLWHPPQERDKKVRVGGNRENEMLRRRYKDARRDVGVMRKLIAEAR